MQIRTATKGDLPRILELGRQFGHQMLYQKEPELMERYLPRILVAVDNTSDLGTGNYIFVVGYYHYIVSGDPGFYEMLRCYRQFPEMLIHEASLTNICVVMQGGCHRDAFREIITYLQSKYPRIWCYNSITNAAAGGPVSSKIAGYKELGFVYNPIYQFTFFNVHKGDHSTYALGKWSRK